MHEIERLSRRISDRLFELAHYEHAYHWELIADALLSMQIPMDEIVMIARKLEHTPSEGELRLFAASIQSFWEAQE